MWWYYDLVVMAILIVCIWNGARKGAGRSMLQLAAMLISAILAFVVSQPLAEFCYTNFVEAAVVSTLENTLDDTASLADTGIVDMVQEELASYGIYASDTEIEEAIADPDAVAAQYGLDADWLNGQIQAAISGAETEDTVPDWLTDGIAAAKSLLINALRVISFVVCFSVMMAILQIVIFCLPNRQIGFGIDALLGAVIGLLKACVLLCLMVLLTKAVVTVTQGENVFFTENTIEQTYFFRQLYAFVQ